MNLNVILYLNCMPAFILCELGLVLWACPWCFRYTLHSYTKLDVLHKVMVKKPCKQRIFTLPTLNSLMKCVLDSVVQYDLGQILVFMATVCIRLSWSVSRQAAWHTHTIPLCRLKHSYHLEINQGMRQKPLLLREHWDLPSAVPFLTRYNTVLVIYLFFPNV